MIDFNFASFLGLVDAIGCVYVDVDHRYLNNDDDDYQPINIQPGYQRLCGKNALSYVRYRHDDSDFVRVARQQDFIRQAKEQLGVWGFLSKWNSLAKAFGKAVFTDIRGPREVARAAPASPPSRSQRPVREVPFQVGNADAEVDTNSGFVSAVTSTPALIKASLDDLLYIHPAAPAIEHSTSSSGSGGTSHHHHHHHVASSSSSSLAAHDLYPLTAGVSEQAFAMSVNVPFRGAAADDPDRAGAARTTCTPTRSATSSTTSTTATGSTGGCSRAGEYYGVEGMNWLDPPLFDNPSATEIAGREPCCCEPPVFDEGWLFGGRFDGVEPVCPGFAVRSGGGLVEPLGGVGFAGRVLGCCGFGVPGFVGCASGPPGVVGFVGRVLGCCGFGVPGVPGLVGCASGPPGVVGFVGRVLGC